MNGDKTLAKTHSEKRKANFQFPSFPGLETYTNVLNGPIFQLTAIPTA